MADQQVYTPQEFAAKIRTKYPGAYDALGDDQLTDRFLAKYPVYRDRVKTKFEQERSGGDGFWKSAGKELGGLASGVADMFQSATNPAGAATSLGSRIATDDFMRQQEGRSLPYRVVAGVGTGLGVNARGMEEAASRGDVGGVAGTAMADAAPVAAAAAGPKLIDAVRSGTGAIGDAMPNLAAKMKAVGKVAGQDAVSRIPIAGRVVRRPSFSDYWTAAKTRAPRGIDALSEAAAGTDVDALSQAASGQWQPPLEGEYVDPPSPAQPQQPPTIQQIPRTNRMLPQSGSVSDYAPYRYGPGEIAPDDISGPQAPNFTITRPQRLLPERSLVDDMQAGEPEFVSDTDIQDYATRGGMQLPSVNDAKWGNLQQIYENQGQGMQLPSADEARSANTDRLLNQVRNWQQERALYDPLSRQTGTPLTQMLDVQQNWYRNPVKNWKGDVIEQNPSAAANPETGETLQPEEEDLTPILRESLRQAMLKKKQ